MQAPAFYVRVTAPTGDQVLVRYGHLGYWALGDDTINVIENLAPDVEQAYIAGSMFGWHVPAAELARQHHGERMGQGPALIVAVKALRSIAHGANKPQHDLREIAKDALKLFPQEVQ